MANACLNNTSVVGCYKDGAGVLHPVVIHYTLDNQGAPKVVITDVAGVVVAGATVANTTAGACVAPCSTTKVAGLKGFANGGNFVTPANITSLEVTVTNGPVTITDSLGLVNETIACCFTWKIQSCDCCPFTNGPFTISGPAGQTPAVGFVVSWTTV
jgi:hypothetical protein